MPEPASQPLSFVIETGQNSSEVVRFLGLASSDSADSTTKSSRQDREKNTILDRLSRCTFIKCTVSQRNQFASWKSEPTTFFKQEGRPLLNWEGHPLHELCYSLLIGQTREQRSEWMLGAMIFHAWRTTCCSPTGDIANLISSVGFEHKDATSLVAKWTKAGEIYSQLSKDLGSTGCLLLLPDWFSTE